MNQARRGSSADDDLRLPRPPGMFRRFWARHPVLGDVLITAASLLLGGVPRAAWTPAPLPWIPSLAALSILLAGAALLRRRQWPMTAFVTAFAAAAAVLVADLPLGGPFVAVTAYGLAVYRSPRVCLSALGTALGALAVLAAVFLLTGLASVQSVVGGVVGQGLFGLVGALIGINVAGRRRYVEAIIDRSRQLLVERDQQAQLAAAAERTRIAREMHDVVSHSLTVIVALAEGATATPDPVRARAATEQISTTGRQALQEMRGMLGVLRAEDADVPLSPADAELIDETVAAARAAGFPVTMRVTGVAGGPPSVRLALARIVQEGLTNAMRHAPGATGIDVTIVYSGDAVSVRVDNDGVRRDRGGGGFGIRGLHERAQHVGGTLVSGPTSPGRWRLHAHLPYRPTPETTT